MCPPIYERTTDSMSDVLISAPTPSVHTKPSLLEPKRIAVDIEGELVVVTIGNSHLRMHYEDALKISQWLRVRAKEAKRLCGDFSKNWSALGTLDGLKE